MDDTELERVNQRIDRMESGLEKINCELGKLDKAWDFIDRYNNTDII